MKEHSLLRYALIGLIAFIFFFVSMFPASIAYNLILKSGLVLPSTVTVNSITGSVWQGEIEVSVGGLKNNRIAWEMLFSRLLLGGVGVSLDANGEDYRLSGGAIIYLPLPDEGFFPLDAELNLDGHVLGAIVPKIVPQYGTTVDGQININSLNIVSTDEGLEDAVGSISWPGGNVGGFVMGNRVNVDLPAVKGEFFQDEESFKFELLRSKDKKLMAQAILASDGWGSVQITQRLFEFFVPVGRGKDPDSIAFEYEYKFF